MLSSSNLIQSGNKLQVNLRSSDNNSRISPEYVISGSAIFQVKSLNYRWHLRFVKLHEDDNLTYTIKVTNESNKIEKCFLSNDDTWHVWSNLDEFQPVDFNIKVVMDIVPGPTPMAPLHEDEDLTDFELRGGDGSVRMHRAVLAASSPVLRRMLCGAWRESTEGLVDVPGTSMSTLQHFKDYVYLQTLPETGLEQLLELASFYMMPELEQKCVFKLVNSLTADNEFNTLNFIVKRNHQRLLLAILEGAKHGSVDIEQIRNHFIADK